MHLESTGVSSSSEVLKISICDLSNYVYLNTLVKPQGTNRWDEAQKINYISPEMVKDSPIAIELASTIRDLTESAMQIVSFNPSYDKRLIKQSFGVDIPKEKLVDVGKQFREDFPEGKHNFEAAIVAYLGNSYVPSGKDSMVLTQIYKAQKEIREQEIDTEGISLE